MPTLTLAPVARWRPVQTGQPDQPVQTIVAARFWPRLAGLLALPPLQAGQALLLSPCNSVHTAFMRQPIDVVYLGRDGRVRKVVPHLAPWRASLCRGAAQALELAAGQARQLGIKPGHPIAWETAP